MTSTLHKMPAPRSACHADRSLPSRYIKRYGWKPGLPDERDEVFNLALMARRPVVLPKEMDLRTSGFMPTVYDQGELGSCTANAIAGAYEFEQRRQGLVDFMPSRLFIYYGERQIECSVEYDSGAEIRDGFKVIAKLGVPDEKLWPYDIGQFTTQPNPAAYTDALQHQCITYAAVLQSEFSVKSTLAAGVPVVFGFTVYQSFEDTGADGVVVPSGGAVLGGHAVMIVGYRMIGSRLYYIVRNSWGSSWADGGYCYFPASWLTSIRHASDFWAIQSVESPSAVV